MRLAALFIFLNSFSALAAPWCTSQNIAHFKPLKATITRLSKNTEDLPVGSRVIVLGKGLIPKTRKILVSNTQGSLRVMDVPTSALLSQNATAPLNVESFIAEARLALQLSKQLDSGLAPEFTRLTQSLQIRLERLITENKITESSLVRARQSLEQLFDHSLSNPELLARYETAIFKELNPIQSSGKTLHDETLFVPLSRAWFESDSKLSRFFTRHWLHSNEDIRIGGGLSGEGVSYSPTESAEINHSFLAMVDLFQKTQAEVQNNGSSKIKDTCESSWLEQISHKDITDYRRMIFFSPDTWKAEMNKNLWAEFIPVDQSLGGLPRDYLFSVMIHETNVNSIGFLPHDTHSEEETSQKLWACIQKRGIGFPQPNAETVKTALALNPSISVIYLAVILRTLEG